MCLWPTAFSKYRPGNSWVVAREYCVSWRMRKQGLVLRAELQRYTLISSFSVKDILVSSSETGDEAFCFSSLRYTIKVASPLFTALYARISGIWKRKAWKEISASISNAVPIDVWLLSDHCRLIYVDKKCCDAGLLCKRTLYQPKACERILTNKLQILRKDTGIEVKVHTERFDT